MRGIPSNGIPHINGNEEIAAICDNMWATQVALGSLPEPACECRDVREVGLIPGSGRSPGGGDGNPLQYPFLENPVDRGAWQATVHKVAKSDTTEVT